MPLWEDFVVGKFLDVAPHIAKVHMVLNKIWSYGDPSTKVEVYVVNATTMRFKVSNPKAKEKILKRGMWNIAGIPMIVTKWTPKSEEEQQEEKAIPMWVHLKKVPLYMYSWEGLSFITSTVGIPDRLHPETIACTNLEIAKVFVQVDVTKTLPKEIDFSKEGKEFTVEFHYPWLPARCNHCDKWGHTQKVCAVISKEKKKNVSSAKKSVSRVLMEDINEVGCGEMIESAQEGNSGKTESTKQRFKELNSWTEVSPEKRSRSQMEEMPLRKEDVQISASKFSVLMLEEEREIEKSKEASEKKVVAEEEIIAVEKEILEAEEGVILLDEIDNLEEELEESETIQMSENELLEDDILEQRSKEKDKVVSQKGQKRGPKPKAKQAKSTRSSRRKN